MFDQIVLGVVDAGALLVFVQLSLAAWGRASAWSGLRRFMASPFGAVTRAAYRWVAPALALLCAIELVALLIAIARPGAGA